MKKTEYNTKELQEFTKGETFWRNDMLYKVMNPYSFDKGYARARCIADDLIERFEIPNELMVTHHV